MADPARTAPNDGKKASGDAPRGGRAQRPVKPKMVSTRKAEKLRRRLYLRGPLDGWSFPLALISSMLFSSGRLMGAVRGAVDLDGALLAWGGSLLFCWICWEVIASAMRSTTWDDDDDPESAARTD